MGAPEQAKLLVNSVGHQDGAAAPPAYTFSMGSPEDEEGRRSNEGPRHETAITSPFYLGAGLVTQGQYEQVMKAATRRRFHRTALAAARTYPVESVSWDDAVRFCRALSELPEEKQAGRVYRLPTEAEWEYACRAGAETPFSCGASLASDAANFDADGLSSPEAPTASGVYPANHFGLHDMHGNVWEWCSDWYAAGYTPAPRPLQRSQRAGNGAIPRGARRFLAQPCGDVPRRLPQRLPARQSRRRRWVPGRGGRRGGRALAGWQGGRAER